MYIKKVLICGFKSYRDLTLVGEFDPGLNVIVGRNGSGKSNLFAAIEFALTLEYRNLRPIDRANLLYNNKGNKQQAESFVEIIFDNQDRKLNFNRDEVSFRRVLGAKKDKFFVDGKELPNAKQFLDTAGFSNPHFIVKQGRINQLAVGTDESRLKLLEDVSGSTTFMDTISSCQKYIEDAETKKAEVDEYIVRLTERKEALEEESKELRTFHALDTDRRAIEHVLNEKEQNAARAGIISCQEMREQLNAEQEPLQKELHGLQKAQQNLNEQMADINAQILTINEKKEEVYAEIPLLTAEMEKIKISEKDFLAQLEEDGTEKASGAKLLGLGNELVDVEDKLIQAKDELDLAKQNEEVLHKKLIEKDSKLKALESRLEGAKQFEDKKERKQWIANIDKEIQSKTEALDLVKVKKMSIENEKKEASKKQEELGNELKVVIGELTLFKKRSTVPQHQLFRYTSERTEQWKKLNEIDQKLSQEKEVRNEIMEQLRKQAGRDVMNGCEGLKKVLEELRKDGDNETVKGYYGLVIENFSCTEWLDKAVEATAGNKLYFHVVQNHSISKRLLRKFNEMGLKGSPTFLPMEEVFLPNVQLPPENNSVYSPMICNIKYEEAFAKIFRYIFGLTLLCRELSDAVHTAKFHKINCVTTDGDKVSRSGPMTGGYFGSMLPKLELQRAKRNCDDRIETLSLQKEDVENELRKLNKDIESATKDREASISKISRLADRKDQFEGELRCVKEVLKIYETKFPSLEKEVQCLECDVYELTCRKANFEDELKHRKPASEKDRALVLDLRKKVKALGKERKEASTEKLAKERLVAELTRKIYELGLEVEEEKYKGLELHSSQEKERQLAEMKEMVEAISDQIKRKKDEVEEVIDNLPELEAQVAQKKSELEKVQEKEKAVTKKLYSVEEKLDIILTKLTGCNNQLHDALKAASMLGTMPPESANYNDKSSRELYQKLKRVKRNLSRTDTVNQKAAEQYEEINKDLRNFISKMELLKKDKEEFAALMKDMELKKGDAILKVFRVLQSQFQQIFSQIVPNGKAELELYGNGLSIDSSRSGSSESDSENDRRIAGGSGVKGIKIKVNFINKKIPDMLHILQLSGGQKSVVALCLLLAIQKVDPVPFYLFDEIDQALDPQYRNAVTNVVQGIANELKIQFICTTFRKEFLSGAHKCFGVSYSRHFSSVRQVSNDEAMDFIENETEGDTNSQEVDDTPPAPDSPNNGNDSSDMMPPPPPPPPIRNPGNYRQGKKRKGASVKFQRNLDFGHDSRG